MKAKNIMIPIQKFLRPEDTLKEAVNILRLAPCDKAPQGVEGLPVLDQAGKIVGMLSMQDILKAVHPFYLSMTETDLGNFTWEGMVGSLARSAGGKLVGACMTRDVSTVQDKDALMECVDRMVKKNVNQLPVLDEHGNIVGMIYERDVFCAITEVMLDKGKGGGL